MFHSPWIAGLSFLALVSIAQANIFADIWAYKNAFEAHADAKRLLEVASSRSTSSSASGSLSETSIGFISTSTAFLPLASSAAVVNATTPSFVIYTNDSLSDANPVPPSSCAAALTSVVSCNYTIQYMSNFVFNASDLQIMCTSTCSNSLIAYRRNVANACSGYSFTTSSNATYPATLGIDTISEPYFSQCRTDTTTGQFCQSVLSNYTPTNPSQGILGYPENELCTSCMLGVLNTTLSYAYTYSSSMYNVLQSALAECGSSWFSYNVSTPSQGAYGTGAPSQTGSNVTVDPTCAIVGRNITLNSESLCSDIATQQSVTVQDILDNNPSISITECASGIASGTELCLPQPCTLYTVNANQTCDDIVADVNTNSLAGANVNISDAQLISFNPALLSTCGNLNLFSTLCITPHGGFTDLGNGGGSAVPSSTPTATVAPPGQTAPGTTSNCGAWYLVQPGDICQQVAINNSITLQDFSILNPEINFNCTNLWAGYYYCVAAYPPLTATSTAPIVTSNSSDASMTFMSLTTATTPLSTQDLPSVTGVPAPMNVASGTITNGCSYYYTMQDGFNCTWIETYFNISDSDFMLYNNNPNPPCPSLSVGSAYCVQVLNATDTIPPIPTNAASGSAPNGCQLWYTVVQGDGCTSIESKFGLSSSEFLTLNPELTSTCTNLVLGEAYCVRAVGQDSAPVPPNAVSGTDNFDCAKYDTVISGDTCASIESRNGISSDLFLALNPEVFANCTNIQLGGAYCVAAVPGYTLSTTAQATPTNVASGTDTKDCAKYDTVISGDTCPIIEARNNVTDSLFRALNPEINAGCTNILLGEAYCVAAVAGYTTTTSTTTTSSPSSTPTNIATGSWTNCTTYYTVVSGDNCVAIDQTYNISFTDFLIWNSEINTACTNIELAEAYCVAGNPKKCRKIYTVASGDFCSKIETSNDLTSAQFLALNPWIDSNCDLQIGENVCVG